MSSRYQKNTTILIWLMILVFWLVILFLDWVFSSHSLNIQTVSVPVETLSSTLQQPKLAIDQMSGHTLASMEQVNTMLTESIHQELGGSEIFKDLNVLEYLYIKNKNPDLLQPLVEQFIQYYQFDKANTYLTLLVAEKGDYVSLAIDPHQVLYARFHDSIIGLDSANSLDTVFTLIAQYKNNNLISADDEMFYKWLKSLWIYDYQTATAAFGKVTDHRYKDFISSYEAALANFMKIKDPPAYYKDWLIALTLLKNWYFSFAKRLALRAVSQNQKYILPYQVLAYTNFLTHHWEAAKDYFLKLADFDTNNISLYKFLIGVSYYRYGDYEQSILYLNQVTDSNLQLDVYRYMLLSYIHNEDISHMISMWHNILGQSDIQASDFVLFFDHMFYMPFRSGKPLTLYFDNTQLVDLYLGKCSTLFTGSQADVCVYGDVWLQLAKQNLSTVGTKLLFLTEHYHQSFLYHLLGDYYSDLKQYTLAKDMYIKALSICDNSTEQTILQNNIVQVTK